MNKPKRQRRNSLPPKGPGHVCFGAHAILKWATHASLEMRKIPGLLDSDRRILKPDESKKQTRSNLCPDARQTIDALGLINY